MDGNGETTTFYVKIWNHPIETSIYKWLALGFQVGGSKNRGNPKMDGLWRKTPIKMDDLGGKPTISGNIHVWLEKKTMSFQKK